MARDGMQFYYGSYTHEKGEVYPRAIEVRPMFNADGIRWASLHRMQVSGDFCSTTGTDLTPTEIGTRIEALENAYLLDYKDCGFKDTDGNDTPHKLETDIADNLSGNKITYRSWDNVMPTEYANTRSFSITIEALMREAYSNILMFRESTSMIGNGGPIFRYHNMWNREPYKEIIANQSKVIHVQRGTLVGLTGWLSPLIYAPPYWPAEEQTWRRVITQYNPRFHGHLSFTRGTHYRTDYTYYFERPNASPVNPSPWP